MEAILYLLALLMVIPVVAWVVTFLLAFPYYWFTMCLDAYREWRSMQ